MGSGLLSNILKHRTAWHIHIVENDDDNKDDDENDDDTDYDLVVDTVIKKKWKPPNRKIS